MEIYETDRIEKAMDDIRAGIVLLIMGFVLVVYLSWYAQASAMAKADEAREMAGKMSRLLVEHTRKIDELQEARDSHGRILEFHDQRLEIVLERVKGMTTITVPPYFQYSTTGSASIKDILLDCEGR